MRDSPLRASTLSCSRTQCRSVLWLQPRTTQSAFASTASASPPRESASVQPDSFTASSQQPTKASPRRLKSHKSITAPVPPATYFKRPYRNCPKDSWGNPPSLPWGSPDRDLTFLGTDPGNYVGLASCPECVHREEVARSPPAIARSLSANPNS